MTSFVNAMIYKHIALSISESIRLSVHVQLVSLLQWHLFSMQWSIHFHHSTHQWTWSYIHMQLVSLLQWRVQSQSLWWASQSVSLLQWHHQCNDLFIILFISESIHLSVHVQLVSLLQWHLFSMQWFTHFHRFNHQWIWSYIHMQLVSLLQWRAQSWYLWWASQSVSLLQWHFYLA